MSPKPHWTVWNFVVKVVKQFAMQVLLCLLLDKLSVLVAIKAGSQGVPQYNSLTALSLVIP